jgi:hypothetical protein
MEAQAHSEMPAGTVPQQAELDINSCNCFHRSSVKMVNAVRLGRAARKEDDT